MKQAVRLFDFNGSNIRVVAEFNGKPYFVARDVAEAIGYGAASPSAVTKTKVISRILSLRCPNRINVKKTDVSYVAYDSLFAGRAHSVALIPESDVYDLVLGSKLPSAQRFRRWVCEVVLPAIRKDGAYIKDEELVESGDMSEDEFVLKAMEIMQNKIVRLRLSRCSAEKRPRA